MDGASKFVHGDAIAGLLIMAINLIGGLILGLVAGLTLAHSAETFSVLSVGDALVSQLPALLISAASGIVVTRSATGEPLGRAFATQLLGRRRAVTLTAGILTMLAMIPGVPALPCLALAGGLFWIGRRARPEGSRPMAAAATKPGETKRNTAEEIDAALSVDLLAVELGYELICLVEVARGGTLLERVASLRKELATECGVVVPPVHVCDNLQLPPGGYRVLLSGNEIGSGECKAGLLLAIDAEGRAPQIEGIRTKDPTFGLPALWIQPRNREMAETLGYAVVDHATVLATHLGELIRNHSHRLIGRQELQHLLDVLAKHSPKLVDDVVPNLLPLGDVLKVVRNLLRERVSVRDMRSVLEALADVAGQTKDPEQLTELVRERMAAQITSRVKGTDGSVAALTLDPRLEDTLRRSLRDIAAGTGGALDPEMLRNLTAAADRALLKFNVLGVQPLLIAPPDLRRYVRAIFERKLPQLWVSSFREVEPSVPLRVVETLGLPAPPPTLHQGSATP
jgi:flagellar biosynthesis protein FlhA